MLHGTNHGKVTMVPIIALYPSPSPGRVVRPWPMDAPDVLS